MDSNNQNLILSNSFMKAQIEDCTDLYRVRSVDEDVPNKKELLSKESSSSGIKLGIGLRGVYEDAAESLLDHQNSWDFSEQEQEPNIQPRMTPPRPARQRSQLIRKYLSSSSVKRKQVKEGNCKFCNRLCNETNLEAHLGESDNCRNYYLRMFRTNQLKDVLLLSLSCVNCSHGGKRLLTHLKKSPRCLRRYEEILGVNGIQLVDKKMINLRQKLKNSRSRANRKLFNEKYNAQKKEAITAVMAINNYHQSVVFANHKKCCSCKGHFLESGGQEMNNNDDRYESFKDSCLPNGVVFLCFQCVAAEPDGRDIMEKKNNPRILKQHDEANNKRIFFPSAAFDGNNNLEEIDNNGKELTILFPVSPDACPLLPKNVKTDPNVVQRISRCTGVDIDDINQIYINQTVKYRNTLEYATLFTAVVDDDQNRKLKDLKPIPQDFNIHSSDAWNYSQRMEMEQRFVQLGHNAIKLEVMIEKSDLEFQATIMKIKGKALTVSFQTGESMLSQRDYWIHLNHSAEEPCQQDCPVQNLEDFLSANRDLQDDFNQFIHIFTTNVFQKVSSFTENILKCKNFSLHSEHFYCRFSFDLSGNALGSMFFWPLMFEAYNKNQSQVSYGLNSEEDSKVELLNFLVSTFSCSQSTEELKEKFELRSSEEAEKLKELVTSKQVSLQKCLKLPSLDAFFTKVPPSNCYENVENAKVIKALAWERLTELTEQDKLRIKTIDWLQSLRSMSTVRFINEGAQVLVQVDTTEVIFTVEDSMKKMIEKFGDPFLGIYHYCLSTVDDRDEEIVIFKRRNLIECFTRMYDPISLTALQAKLSMKIISKDSDYFSSDFNTSTTGNTTDFGDISAEVKMCHQEIHINEAVSLIDSRKNRVLSSPPIVYVNTNPHSKDVFLKVNTVTEDSFTSIEVRGTFEKVFNVVSRHRLRLNGESLLLCETSSYFEFIGNEKSKEIFEMIGQNIQKIPLSEVVSPISGNKLPEMIVCSNGQILKIRKNRKVINFPRFEQDSDESTFASCLLFYPLPPGHELDMAESKRFVDVIHESQTLDGDGKLLTTVQFNEKLFYGNFVRNKKLQ